MRFIASADVISFIRQKVIYDGLVYRYTEYDLASVPEFSYNGVKFRIALNAYTGLAQTYVNMNGAGSENIEYMCPTDFGTFDFNPAAGEIFCVIDELASISETEEIAALFKSGQCDSDIWMDGERVGTYRGGLPSGWFLTSALGSILNIYWNVRAIIKTGGFEGTALNAMGDDSNLNAKVSVQKYMDYIENLREMGLNVHVDKTSFRSIRSEFLRCTTVVPMQYLARCVHSVIQRNEKNASAIFESLQGTKGNIVQILNKYNTAMIRMKHKSEPLMKLAYLELEHEREKCNAKHDVFYTWLALPNYDGGFGCTWANDYAVGNAYGPIDTIVANVDYDAYDEINMTTWVDRERYKDILDMGVLSKQEGQPFKLRWVKKVVVTKASNVEGYSKTESEIITRAILQMRTGYRLPIYGTIGRDSFIYSSRVMEMIKSGLPYKRRVELLKIIGLKSKEAKVVAKMQIADSVIVPFVMNGMCGSTFCGMMSTLVGASKSMLRSVTSCGGR